MVWWRNGAIKQWWWHAIEHCIIVPSSMRYHTIATVPSQYLFILILHHRHRTVSSTSLLHCYRAIAPSSIHRHQSRGCDGERSGFILILYKSATQSLIWTKMEIIENKKQLLNYCWNRACMWYTTSIVDLFFFWIE